MNFINKLIKKGIFSLVMCFAFFAFFGAESISAESNCTIDINDGDEYLVLNTGIDWSDSGVSVYCDSVKQENVSVSINGSAPIHTTDSGRDVSKGYLVNAGFYKIKYYLTNDSSVSITRQVRVLPNNLNSVRNIWLGEFNESTAYNDVFVKIVSHGDNYLTIGNFGTSGYLVYFNSFGQYEWHEVFENTVLMDVASSGDVNGDIFFIVGQNENVKGFIKPIQLSGTTGVNDLYGTMVEISSADESNNMTMANKVVVGSNYVYVAGYLVNASGTKVGKIVRFTENGGSLGGATYYSNDVESEYKSLITIQSDGLKVVGVGTTVVYGHTGATGGLITICDEGLSSCDTKDPYIWQNSNGASTTTTAFNDIVKQGDNYLVVGKSRVDRVVGVSASNNSGVEDSLVVLLDNNFSIIDVALRGSSSTDELYSIKELGIDNYVAVGKRAGQGLYVFINVVSNVLYLEENSISGKNGNVEFRDVFVRKEADEEINLVFVGSSQATMIENIIHDNNGLSDALLVILDNTGFANYGDINILQNSTICDGNLSSCPADQLLESYRLSYGTRKIVLSSSSDISSQTIGQIAAYHSFENEQGVKFILGRLVVVSANPIAPDISFDQTGIDKWYLYSRTQTVGTNVALRDRQELWTTRYMPIDNNLDKELDETYYIISGGEFVEDTSGRDYTYSNYIKLADESLNSTVAFQSIEKAQEFALLQEFARVAFVKTKYSYETTGITSFQGETANLATQNYYFVYYIDLEITKVNGCGTNNGVLYGTCTEYTGYAFSSLSRIKEIAKLIVEKYNYFVSESSNRFNPKGNVSFAESDYFKEEMATEKHMKNTSISLSQNLYLEVTHYPVIEGTYEIDAVGVTTTVTGKTSVVFSSANNADYKEEGRYVVRYCYSYGAANQDCGESASFVIDRTAPLVKYNLMNGNKGTIAASSSMATPLLITTSMTVSEIVDIDPYAYTIVNGKKYYLQCNAEINSQTCIKNISDYITKAYSYQKDDKDKLYNITVYDRAGNYINSYFKVGTVMPKVSIVGSVSNDSFTLNLEFFERNDIDSFNVSYTKSEECSEAACANAADISGKILTYINALVYNNNLELDKVKEDEEYKPNITYSVDLIFSYSRVNADDTISGGLSLPKITIEEVDGVKTYTFVEGETELLPISKGLYKFTLADTFHNISEAFGGIGLDKAELYIYVNNDDDAVESVETVTNKIPMTSDEIGDIVQENVFLAKEPSKYEFVDKLPTDLLNDFDENMFFTKKFVYVKFKKSEFGIIRISKANSLNTVGGYGNSEEANVKLSCLFKIYGGQVPFGDVGDCDSNSVNDIVPLTNISNYESYLNDEGIYSVGEFNGYHYLAFTEEGTYDIWSEVYVNITNAAGATNEWTAIPVYYAFTIDNTSPDVDFEIVCSDAPCLGEKASFVKDDFTGVNASKANIGNYSMKLKIDVDLLKGDSVNRLLVVSINGETSNAYGYSLANSDLVNGNYIMFEGTGTYTITFYDAAKNSITYTFIIDKSAPTIDKMEDINGKTFGVYNQYVEIQFIVKESSFLENNTDKNMLTFQYWIDSGEKQEISVKNDGENCVISTGKYEDGSCAIETNLGVKGLRLSFVIPINKDAATRDPSKVFQNLNIKVTDYFGNEGTKTLTVAFDNYNPYLYFSNEYTPILDFGENVSNDEREKMLTMSANSSYGVFNCSNGIDFTVGQKEVKKQVILCGDTPNSEGMDNKVTVETYEAYRVSFNNYRKNADNTYTLLANGTYLGVNDTVYKKRYTSFAREQILVDYISAGKNVYSKGNFIQVTNKEYIDPNVVYYDVNGNNGVSIQDMYTNTAAYSSCESSSSRLCILYNMYNEDGTFESNQDFYVYDTNEYKLITDSSTIITSDFLNYYYTNETYKVDQGKYLPALTLENACIKVNSNACKMVKSNRIKLKSFDANIIIYYSIIKIK
jgi:hypothetical protein